LVPIGGTRGGRREKRGKDLKRYLGAKFKEGGVPQKRVNGGGWFAPPMTGGEGCPVQMPVRLWEEDQEKGP